MPAAVRNSRTPDLFVINLAAVVPPHPVIERNSAPGHSTILSKSFANELITSRPFAVTSTISSVLMPPDPGK